MALLRVAQLVGTIFGEGKERESERISKALRPVQEGWRVSGRD